MPIALRAVPFSNPFPAPNTDPWPAAATFPVAVHFGHAPDGADHFVLFSPSASGATTTAVPAATVTALFNDMIAELLAAPRVGDTTRRVVLGKDCFYLWPYREPSVFGKKPFAHFGFLMPQGTEVLVHTRVVATATGFQRTIEIEVATPGDQLGAIGPLNLHSADPLLSTTRIAKTIFHQTLDAQGAVRSERTQLGLTFHDAETGARRNPSWIEAQALTPTAVPHRGGTLYLIEATNSLREVFAHEQPRLQKAAELHGQETGQILPAGSTANIAAYLKYTWRHGMGLADGKFADRVRRIKDRLGYPSR